MSCVNPFKKKLTVQKKKVVTNGTFKELREKIRNASAICDNKSPKFKIDTVLKSTQKKEDFERSVQHVKENLHLIAKINEIARTHGLVDNYHKERESHGRKRRHDETEFNIHRYERENYELAQKVFCTQGKLPTRDQLLKDWKKNLKEIRKKAKQPIVLKELLEDDLTKEIYSNPRNPLVFFNLMLKDDERYLGRLEIVLFYDVVPNIVLNFIDLCKNRKFQTSNNKKKVVAQPSLVGTSFYRIFPGLYVEGGDMIYENGCGGMAADGVDFYPDNFNLNHDCRGTLAMIPNREGKVNSRFTISFKSLNCLNGKRPAFGRVIKGLCLLPFIQSNGRKNGKPKTKIVISDCGLIDTL